MKRFMTRLGVGLILVVSTMIIHSQTAQAQPAPIDPPECMAPCYVDLTSDKLICPCDKLTNGHAVPEPMTLALLGSGLVGAAALKKRKK